MLAAQACFLGGSPGDNPLQDARAPSRDTGLSFELDAFPASDASVGPTSFKLLTPTFGSTVVATTPPPPISGGTLLVTHDGALAVAADPDRDLVYGVNLTTRTVAYTVALQNGDEPGRVAEDGAGRAHVALRASGALLTIDEKTGAVLARRGVCPAPRGVAWDSATDLVWVACATGELVGLPASGGPVASVYVVERDLRDVVVLGNTLAVSKLRSAEILRIDAGAITRRDALPSPDAEFTPHAAWRTVAGPKQTVVTVHQAASTKSIVTAIPNAYGGGGGKGCGGEGPPPLPPPSKMPPPQTTTTNNGIGVCGENDGGVAVDACLESSIVMSVLSVMSSDGVPIATRQFPGAVPVDVAVSPDGSTFAAVAPGNAFVQKGLGTVFSFSSCGDMLVQPRRVGVGESIQPTAVAFDASGHIIVQTREPAGLWIFADDASPPISIPLSTISRRDTGHDIFNTQAGAMIACASCHPEGGDDGHVWLLDANRRRTPSLRGTIAGTAPYHWPGDQKTLQNLVNDVYTLRMSGVPLSSDQMNVLTGWVQTIPAPPAPMWVDWSAAQRGQALFTSSSVGCATCHSGDKLTNNQTVDVDTGGAFQVPPLIGVGWRTPLLHDGCATTIADRFGKCSTAAHGSIGALSSEDIANLGAYLESL